MKLEDIKEEYRPLFSDLGFTNDGYQPSIEKFVIENWRDTKCDQVKMSINRCPELVRSTVVALRRKHQKLTSQAAVTRCLTRHGLQILQKIPLSSIKDKRKWAYEEGSERDRVLLSRRVYDFGYRMSMTADRQSVYAEEWVGAALAELAYDIGTSLETTTIMSLVAALSTSDKWVPKRHLSLMYDELFHFVKWVEGLTKNNDSP